MNIDSNPLQQASLLQRLAAAKHRVAHNGVVLTKKARRERLPQRLLLKEPQRTKATISEERLIGYLQMIKDGYVWSDHFETLGGGAAGVARTPDFVFLRPGNADVALVESKGTRSASQAAFDSSVDDGYTGQVEPHLGYYVGGLLASHGFCVGAWLGDRRIDVAEVLDAWLAPEYRCFKLRGADGDTYLVRHDERSHTWELTMFRGEHTG